MENKEMTTSKKITEQLIGSWILWGILFFFICNLIDTLMAFCINSNILGAIITIILKGISVFFMWKLSIYFTFKKRTMLNDDVRVVMKNLIIFTIIICVVNSIYNFARINSEIDKVVNSSTELKSEEAMMSYFYSDKQMSEYNEQKEKEIQEVKNQYYMYLTIEEIGLTIIYLAVLPSVKKQILKSID